MNPAARALLARFTPSEIAERCVAAEAEFEKLRKTGAKLEVYHPKHGPKVKYMMDKIAELEADNAALQKRIDELEKEYGGGSITFKAGGNDDSV